MAQHISYRTVKVDGLSIFYREAGPKDAPTILLLHGLPSSSRMFEPLLTRLAGQFHAVSMADQCFSFSSMAGRSEERQRDGIHRKRRVGADVIKK
jgi:pimeloyl-ACP methyl ester carboxylesterase